MSRNKREGQYAGSWIDPFIRKGMKHHRIYQHRKPQGFRSVGMKLLAAIF